MTRPPLKTRATNNYIDFRAGAGDFEHNGLYAGNVGNVRYSSRNNWRGQVTPPERGFCRFTDCYFGFRAVALTIRSYLRAGLVTYQEIITRYAPPSENKTDYYIRMVCSFCGSRPTDLVTSSFDVVRVSLAVVYMETNYRPSLDEVIHLYDELTI